MSAPSAQGPLFTRPFVRLLATQAAFGFALSAFLLLPKVLATAFASTPAEIGLVMAAFGLASVLSIPIVGRAIDTFGQRGALVASNVIMAVGALGFAAATGAGTLAVVMRGLHGVAWSLGFAAGIAIAADLAPPSRLAQAVGIYGAASLAMNAIAPAVVEPLGERFGHRVVFVLASAAALLGAAIARRLPVGRPHLHALSPPAERGAPAAGRGKIYLVLGMSGLAFGVMFTFIAPYALVHGVRAVRGFFAAYTVAALAVRLLATPLSDRLGHRRSALGSGTLYGIVVIATGILGPAHLLAVGAGFGAAHGALFPALMAMVLADTRGRHRARVLALANGAMNLGITAVFALGFVAEHLGYPLVFVLAGALMIATSSLLHRAVRSVGGD